MRALRLVLAALLLITILSACASDDETEPTVTATIEQPDAPTSEPVTPTPGPVETTAPDSTTAPDPSDPPTETASADPAALENGRHPVYLRGLDVGARTLTVDVIQFLTGEEAAEAYQSEYPDEPDGPPNDYWIVNVNPRLRTLPVSDDVTVELVRLEEDGDADLDPGTWEELPGYLEAYDPGDARLSYNPFWITIVDGTVTAVAEQYIP